MRLSDVRGERVFDVIADLVDPIANIAEDEDASALFRRGKLPEGMTATQYLAERARKALPALLRTHRDDVIAILSTIQGVSAEEYASGLNMAKLFADVIELMTDEEFLTFLPSNGTKKPGTASGDASESTEDREEPAIS